MSNKDANVDLYIDGAPDEIKGALRTVRELIREVAPEAEERTDYFELPGYSYEGYDYNGMFVWFSYRKLNVRLHVRPPVLENHKGDTRGLKQTKSIIDFSVKNELPEALIKKLVNASIEIMQNKE